MKTKEFTDKHGVTLVYDIYPVKNPRGVVQIMHGLGDHAGRYAHVAAALNSAGYSVYAPDQRGHGRTGVKQFSGDLSRLGHLGPGGLSAAVENFSDMTAIIRKENPGVPIVLLGHSMGSLMGQILINERAGDYAAVIWSGSAYRMPGYMEAGDLNKKFAGPNATGHEWLSRDPQVWANFKNDPWTFDAKVLKLYGVKDGLKLFGKTAKNMAQVPLLIILGEDDSVGGKKSGLKLAESYIERSGQTDVTVGIYPEARHEIFNETNKEAVIDDMIVWLSERIPG
jgi:alpha-beta hydrolase superfamily lysophospholipase